MTSADPAARLGPGDSQHLLTVGGRLFKPESLPPCRRETNRPDGRDLWFSPFRDREQAAVRDYFMVEDESGERFWIFRSGDGEHANTGSQLWFLHGLFG